MPEWTFTDLVCRPRQERLLAPTTFDAITKMFVANIGDIAGKVEPWGTDRKLRHLYQLWFWFEVRDDLGDFMFNSPYGLRGCFSESVERGIAANRKVIDAIEQRLVEAVAHLAPEVDSSLLRRALADDTTKVWVWEKLRGFSFDGPVGIRHPRWNAAAEADPTCKARYGITALRRTWFEVKTAFWSKTSGEVVGHPSPDKQPRVRGQHIHEYGWA